MLMQLVYPIPVCGWVRMTAGVDSPRHRVCGRSPSSGRSTEGGASLQSFPVNGNTEEIEAQDSTPVMDSHLHTHNTAAVH